MPNNIKKITVLLTEEDRNRLKSILALKGLTISDWVRTQIEEYFEENDK